MRIRTYAAAAAIAAALPLIAACGSQGTAERADSKPAAADKNKVDCTSQEISQADWMKHCADDAGNEKAPDTELKFGDKFRYSDGVTITITRVERFTNFSEYDGQVAKDDTPFRAHVKITNGSKKPVNLDDMTVFVSGATTGGEAETTAWENGASQITGRIAPGVTANKTEDGVLKKKYGTQALVTVQRLVEDDLLMDDPNWTGPIR